MTLSVVIPAFNEELYIAACLDSILAQEEPADEIIVVDNNSTDRTREIVSRYPVILLTEKNQGITYSRNCGFNAAKYDIIARTDADTIVPPNWIKQIKKSFRKTSLVGLSGPAYYTNAIVTGKGVATLPTKTFFQSLRQVLGHDSLFGPNMSIRRSAWEKMKDTICLNDKTVHEDIDLAIHLAPFGQIKFDTTLVVTSSPRRWKKVKPYFEYSYRSLKMLRTHHVTGFENASKSLARKMMPKSLMKQIAVFLLLLHIK